MTITIIILYHIILKIDHYCRSKTKHVNMNSFGNIYLGESFRGFISLVNHTSSPTGKKDNNSNANSDSSPSSVGNNIFGSTIAATISNTNNALGQYANSMYDNVVNSNSNSNGGDRVSPGSLSSSMGTMSIRDSENSNDNTSNATPSATTTASHVSFKAELHTERNRVLLYESDKSSSASGGNAKSPNRPSPQGLTMAAGDSSGFIVEHDIKEVGTHTLVCSVTYSDSFGERRYMPQYFKFQVTNPLAVRTKVRSLSTPFASSSSSSSQDIFVEVCVENVSKEPMLLESISFEAAAGISREKLKLPSNRPLLSSNNNNNNNNNKDESTTDRGRGCGNNLNNLTSTIPPIDLLNRWSMNGVSDDNVIITNGKENDSETGKSESECILLNVGSSRHTLFRLKRIGDKIPNSDKKDLDPSYETGTSTAPSNVLGRVELKWRRGLGERGRLQTQQISSGTQPQSRQRDIDVKMVPPFPEPTLDSPFTVKLAITNPSSSAHIGGGDQNSHVNVNFNSMAVMLTPTNNNNTNEPNGGINGGGDNDCMLYGQQRIPIGEVGPNQEKLIDVQLVALVPGILRLTGLAVVQYETTAMVADGKDKVVAKVPPIELFVKSPAAY